MKKIVSLMFSIVLVVACCFTFTACSKKKPVVGLICLHGTSSTYDKNFIDAFEAACAQCGLSKEEYTIVTDIPEDQTCYNAAADLADSGCKGIFADSFGHEQYMIQAAKEFTDVQFAHATGTQSTQVKLPNFHNAFASIYEGRYLAGYAAGLKLNEMYEKDPTIVKEGKIKVGYIGAFTYAEVISGYTSWFLGVQAGCTVPDATVEMEVIFTGSWYDETGEKTSAETLISNGCVLISQHADSMGAPTACDNAGVPNVAYNGETGKDTFVIYSKINWIPYFVNFINCAIHGTGLDTDSTGTLKDGSVYVSLAGKNAAEGTDLAIEVVRGSLENGTLKIFDCSKFTVGGQHLTTYLADVSGDYVPDTEAIVTEGGVTYFTESYFRSAPYFDIRIDGITLLNEKF